MIPLQVSNIPYPISFCKLQGVHQISCFYGDFKIYPTAFFSMVSVCVCTGLHAWITKFLEKNPTIFNDHRPVTRNMKETACTSHDKTSTTIGALLGNYDKPTTDSDI